METYETRESFGDKHPYYAILSHTWGDEEVTFQDITRLHNAGKKAYDGPNGLYYQILGKKGYVKITYTCRQAREDQLAGLGSIRTVLIRPATQSKRDWRGCHCPFMSDCSPIVRLQTVGLSKFSEAIKSMFQWYTSSSRCYAYQLDALEPDNPNCKVSLKASQWFTRGWTLQELIAPQFDEFLWARLVFTRHTEGSQQRCRENY